MTMTLTLTLLQNVIYIQWTQKGLIFFHLLIYFIYFTL